MARYLFVAQSGPVEGREAEYHDWYENHHFPALLACPGVVSGRRCTLAPVQVKDGTIPFPYLGLIEVETDDLPGFLREMNARAMSGQIPRSSPELCVNGPAVFWQVMEPGAAPSAPDSAAP